jgi:hypothetical protein
MRKKVSGFFIVKGSKKTETIYCSFYPNQNGTTTAACSSRFLVIFCLTLLFEELKKWIGYPKVKIIARQFLQSPEK